MISIIAVLAVAGLAIWIAFKDARLALSCAVFLLPWFGLEAEIGLRLTAYQVMVTALWLRLLLTPRSGRSPAAWGGFLAYAAYMIGRSAIQIPFLPEAAIAGGIFRGPALRPLAQIVYFLVTLTPVMILSKMHLKTGDVARYGKIYVTSCVILAILGWMQLGVWYATGKNIFPIGVALEYLNPGARVGSGIVFIGDEIIYRMNSLGGEPKDLGRSLVVGVIVLIAGALAGKTRARVVAFVGGFLIASIFMTFSTSAFALLAIGVLVMIGASVTRISGRAAIGNLVFYTTVILVVGLGSVGYALSKMVAPEGTDNATVIDVIRARTIGRGQILEDFDQAIVPYLLDDTSALFFGVGMGNVHLYAQDYLDPEVAVYAAGTPFNGKHGLIRTLADGGVVALLLLTAWILGAVITARGPRKTSISAGPGDPTMLGVMKALAVALFALYLGNVGLAPHLYLAIGLLGRTSRK